jgi:hypothetical protein
MTAAPSKKPVPDPPRRVQSMNLLFIAAGVAICVGAALLFAARDMIFGTAPPPSPPAAVATTSMPEASSTQQAETPPVTVAEESAVIDDDGKTLWESPTAGKPLDLAYLPPGSQIILALRPAALLKHPEGEKVIAAFGRLGKSAVEHVERTVGQPLSTIDRLVVGCQPSSSGWLSTLVVYTAQPISVESLRAELASPTEKEHAGQKYLKANSLAYFQPTPGGDVLVIAPDESIADIIDLAGQTPPLRRDIERLLEHTDADRDLTVIFAPNSLFSEGQHIFSGEFARLRDPLFWFLGDELSGADLSLHWDDNFFIELSATPTLEKRPEEAATIFAERVAQIPALVESYTAAQNPQPYGRLVIARLPEMLRKLVAYTRTAAERDYFVMRCYLPAIAAHNLVLATELTLAEPPSNAVNMSVAQSTTPAASAPVARSSTISDKLAKVTSLKFARDTLESALDQLSQDIGAPIVIRGPDLQADGITKNQSFGIDVSNKPAQEILVEILRLANPDKTSPGPNDVRQKLVYVIEQAPDKTEQVVVTTRSRAAERHQELPAAFRTEQKPERKPPAASPKPRRS